MFDDQCTPWLLEINGNPSLNQDHKVDPENKNSEVVVSPIDRHIKEKVLQSTIELVMMSKEKQQKIDVYKDFESLQLEKTMQKENMTILRDLITIFKALSGATYKTILPMSKFRKMAYMSFMKNPKFGKADYDILYKRIMNKSASGQMDFYGFIEAI